MNTKYGNFGMKLNLWNQPKMLLKPIKSGLPYYIGFRGYISPEFWIEPVESEREIEGITKDIFGAACSFTYSYNFRRVIRNVYLELGYKTNGYLPGESLRHGPIMRLGVHASF